MRFAFFSSALLLTVADQQAAALHLEENHQEPQALEVYSPLQLG